MMRCEILRQKEEDDLKKDCHAARNKHQLKNMEGRGAKYMWLGIAIKLRITPKYRFYI